MIGEIAGIGAPAGRQSVSSSVLGRLLDTGLEGSQRGPGLVHAADTRQPARRFGQAAPEHDDEQCADRTDQQQHPPTLHPEQAVIGDRQRQEAKCGHRHEGAGVGPCRQASPMCLRQHVGQVGIRDRIFRSHPYPGHETGADQQQGIGGEGADDAPHGEPHQIQQKRPSSPDAVGDPPESRCTDEHSEERRCHQQLQGGAAEAVLRLERGGDGAGQEDLVDLEEQSQPDRDHHLAVNAPHREMVESPADVTHGGHGVGVQRGCHFEGPFRSEWSSVRWPRDGVPSWPRSPPERLSSPSRVVRLLRS